MTLIGVPIRRCPNCENYEVDIPHVEELHRCLAEAVAMSPGKLTGAEIRFLRKALGWSGLDLARRFGVQPESVSRWENGHLTMNATAQRLLRVLVLSEKPVQAYDDILLDNMRRPATPEPLCARLADDRWRTEHASVGGACASAK